MMSQLAAVFLLILALMAVACLNNPAESGLCCDDPAHQAPPNACEMMYCPTRGS
jgi:hypothetical protein